MGIRLGIIELGPRGYALKGVARKLASPQNDAVLALIQEVAELHYRLISITPLKLGKGELWKLEDQEGLLTARSSRVPQAFQTEAIDRTFLTSGVVRLLEIGCGSAIYIGHAAAQNPALSAVGLKLQAEVAETTWQNIRQMGPAAPGADRSRRHPRQGSRRGVRHRHPLQQYLLFPGRGAGAFVAACGDIPQGRWHASGHHLLPGRECRRRSFEPLGRGHSDGRAAAQC